MVIFLSFFFKDLRKHLITIYELQISKNKLQWTEECVKALEQIKELLITLPVLFKVTANDKFWIQSVTSETVCGRVVFHFHQVQWVVNGYYSKKTAISSSKIWNHKATVDRFGMQHTLLHSITEIWIFWSFSTSQGNRTFTKNRKEPPINRLTVLLLKLRDYTFDLKYIWHIHYTSKSKKSSTNGHKAKNKRGRQPKRLATANRLSPQKTQTYKTTS